MSEDVGRVLLATGRRDGAAAEIGEVERALGFEELGVGEKDLAFMMSHITPLTEIGLCDRTGSEGWKRRLASCMPGRQRERFVAVVFLQLFSSLKMLIVVKELITPLSPWAMVNAIVFAWLRWVRLTNGSA